MRALTGREYADYLGTARPARADWDRFRGTQAFDDCVPQRGTGRALILWADGAPSEIAFWGYSGD